ncbi:hypothetical protein JTB14_008940 [Gonioctena quinquepunctata]|nr:hypothetical protein JTB14_008940 [Gonioctena quinquepunctata]
MDSLGKVRYSSWLKAIGRNPEENISPLNVICSKHFPESDFVVKQKRAVLKTDAVPKLLLPKNAPFTSQSKMSSPGPISRDPVPTDASLQRIDGNLSSSDSGSHPKPLITSLSDSAGWQGVQKRNRKLVRTFHTYASSPDMFKTRYMNERTKYHQLRYKHQLEKEKNRRLRNKVSHLKQVNLRSVIQDGVVKKFCSLSEIRSSASSIPRSSEVMTIDTSKKISPSSTLSAPEKSCQLDVDLKHHATPTSTPKSHQRTTTDPSKIQTVPVHPKEEIKPIHLEKIPLDELHKLHDIQDHMTPLFYEQDSDYTHLWTTPVYIAIAASVGISCFKYYHCLPCQMKATMTPPSEPPVLFVPYKTSSGDGEVTK